MAALDGTTLAVESVRVSTPSREAHALGVESVRLAPQLASRVAHALGVESVRLAPQLASRDAHMLAVETVVVPTNPGLIYMWNPNTSLYERYPWFYWDSGSSTWKQAF